MILILSDVHCRLEVIAAQLAHARAQGPVAAIVILGDVGLFEPFLSRFFAAGRRFEVPVYFIEGNHEDFVSFAALVERYADVMTHLPRGTLRVIAGWRVLALGGAAYMDAHATPPGAVIDRRDIERCLEHPADAVDVVISHDCPADLGVPSTPGLEYYGPPGFAGGEALLRRFRPRLWLFGHHHRWFHAERDGTEFIGFAESWAGYGLLHDDGRVSVVEHALPPPPGAWARTRDRLASWRGWLR